MNILVINGPNLNMLGVRDKNIYGNNTYKDLVKSIKDYIHKSIGKFDAIIINAGAYTHYSYAIKDALNLVKIPKVEVHISNIYEREDFRKISVIKDECDYSIVGQGIKGYLLAIDYLRK